MKTGRYFAFQYDTGNYPYSPYNPYNQPHEYKYSTFGTPNEKPCSCHDEPTIKPWMWAVGGSVIVALVFGMR